MLEEIPEFPREYRCSYSEPPRHLWNAYPCSYQLGEFSGKKKSGRKKKVWTSERQSELPLNESCQLGAFFRRDED